MDSERDLSQRADRQDQLEYERGRREAMATAHTKEQDQQISELRRMVDSVDHRLSDIERQFERFTAVAQAIADKGVSTRTFLVGLGGVLIALVTLFLTATGHH